MDRTLSPDQVEQLVAAAEQARERAYAPYSRFRVGAALLCESGDIVRGANVENASFGLCICAERTAVSTAVVQGRRDFIGIAIMTGSSPPSTPCGMCRQVLAEFCRDLDVVLCNDKGERLRTTLKALFPNNFDARLLQDGADTEPTP